MFGLRFHSGSPLTYHKLIPVTELSVEFASQMLELDFYPPAAGPFLGECHICIRLIRSKMYSLLGSTVNLPPGGGVVRRTVF